MPRRVLAALALALLASSSVSAQALLHIHIDGLASSSGSVRIAVFDSEETYLGDARYAVIQPIVNRASSWAVSLPPGDYAVVVHHDVDGDGEVARGLFNLPTEPVGFSNGARVRFGPPSWRRARVGLPAEGARITVRVR